jgi:hypothetical protein
MVPAPEVQPKSPVSGKPSLLFQKSTIAPPRRIQANYSHNQPDPPSRLQLNESFRQPDPPRRLQSTDSYKQPDPPRRIQPTDEYEQPDPPYIRALMKIAADHYKSNLLFKYGVNPWKEYAILQFEKTEKSIKCDFDIGEEHFNRRIKMNAFLSLLEHFVSSNDLTRSHIT